MLKIENVEIAGWEAAIRGMRNPKNSWDRSDSDYRPILCSKCDECETMNTKTWDDCKECDVEKLVNNAPKGFMVGPNDMNLMLNLAKGGPVHAKYRRMIVVWLDITAPLYWWKEFDTYKVGTVANSCSTMHKIHDKEFTVKDFSCEHMRPLAFKHLLSTIKVLNEYRDMYLNGGRDDNLDGTSFRVFEPKDKDAWWQMIQLLPSSYNQKRTIKLNYEVLHHIYHDRRNHKLDEWHVVCDWIESLPYSEIITQKVVGIE